MASGRVGDRFAVARRRRKLERNRLVPVTGSCLRRRRRWGNVDYPYYPSPCFIFPPPGGRGGWKPYRRAEAGFRESSRRLLPALKNSGPQGELPADLHLEEAGFSDFLSFWWKLHLYISSLRCSVTFDDLRFISAVRFSRLSDGEHLSATLPLVPTVLG